PEQTPESYLGTQRANSFGGGGDYSDGTHDYRFPKEVAYDQFALRGTWTLDAESISAGKDAAIRLNFKAQHVYLDVGGTGTLTVTRDGVETSIRVSGAPNIYDLVSLGSARRDTLDVELSPGLKAYSFTFG
ncbi:MAG TPA: hypothetical protein VIQ78_03550, partial [Terrimesophilobacter sp.]